MTGGGAGPSAAGWGAVSERAPWPPNLVLDVPFAEVDDAVGLLWSLEPVAVTEEPTPDGRPGCSRFVSGFGDEPAAAAALQATAGRWAARLEPVEDDSWPDRWRDGANTTRVGPLVLHPAWLPVPALAPGEVLIAIDPVRSFGAGTHPTTRLALAGLVRAVRPGSSVLDVGSGSGILAVAAARLGAERVVAIDVDPAAVDATQANAARNDVAASVVARSGTIEVVAEQFGTVVANLGGSRVVVDLADALAERVARGGRLIVSGLLTGQHEDALEAVLRAVQARTGRVPISAVTEEDGWAALVLSDPGADLGTDGGG